MPGSKRPEQLQAWPSFLVKSRSMKGPGQHRDGKKGMTCSPPDIYTLHRLLVGNESLPLPCLRYAPWVSCSASRCTWLGPSIMQSGLVSQYQCSAHSRHLSWKRACHPRLLLKSSEMTVVSLAINHKPKLTGSNSDEETDLAIRHGFDGNVLICLIFYNDFRNCMGA